MVLAILLQLTLAGVVAQTVEVYFDTPLLEGDSNQDHIVNADDFNLLVIDFYGPNPRSDFNRSGVVNADDFNLMVASFYEESPQEEP